MHTLIVPTVLSLVHPKEECHWMQKCFLTAVTYFSADGSNIFLDVAFLTFTTQKKNMCFTIARAVYNSCYLKNIS